MSWSRSFLRRGFQILHSARLPPTDGSHIGGGLSSVGRGRGMCSSDDSDYLPPGTYDPLGDFYDAFIKTCACVLGLNMIWVKSQTDREAVKWKAAIELQEREKEIIQKKLSREFAKKALSGVGAKVVKRSQMEYNDYIVCMHYLLGFLLLPFRSGIQDNMVHPLLLFESYLDTIFLLLLFESYLDTMFLFIHVKATSLP